MSTRKEYVDKLKAKLDEWNAEIDLLAAKARQSQAQAEQKYIEQVADLKRRRDDAEIQLKKVQESSEEAWHTLKEGADRVWENMNATLQETKKAFLDGLK